MSNVAINKLGLKPEVLRNVDKHENLPTHDLHVGQYVMYQDSASKQWHPAIITSLCQEKQCYKIRTTDGLIYQKTQAHLKPYTLQNNGITRPQSTNGATRPQSGFTRSQSTTSNNKQAQKGY